MSSTTSSKVPECSPTKRGKWFDRDRAVATAVRSLSGWIAKMKQSMSDCVAALQEALQDAASDDVKNQVVNERLFRFARVGLCVWRQIQSKR